MSNSKALPPYALNGRSAKDVVAMIGFSSGTTGKTKGVTLSHYNLNSAVFLARLSTPDRVRSSNVEVWFAPCKLQMIPVNSAPGFSGLKCT
jgi:long-subunit acyl-CoA synthetase (AMP-forming)